MRNGPYARELPYLQAQPPGLLGHPAHKLCAGDAFGEPGIVLDMLGVEGCAAGELPFKEHGPYAGPHQVYARSQPRRPSSDDYGLVQVVHEIV